MICSEGVSDPTLSDQVYQVATASLPNAKYRGVLGDVANHNSKLVQDFVHQPTETLHRMRKSQDAFVTR